MLPHAIMCATKSGLASFDSEQVSCFQLVSGVLKLSLQAISAVSIPLQVVFVFSLPAPPKLLPNGA